MNRQLSHVGAGHVADDGIFYGAKIPGGFYRRQRAVPARYESFRLPGRHVAPEARVAGGKVLGAGIHTLSFPDESPETPAG